MELKDKTVIITGSTGGLGWRVCLAMAAEGAKVCMVYNNSKDKAEANLAYMKSKGHEAIAIKADITNESGIDEMIETTFKTFGRADGLVLDAAYNTWIPFNDLEKLDAKTWNYMMNFNLTAPYLAVRRVAPIMKKQGSGRIVMVTSIGGLYPAASSIAYAVSKAALIHLTKCLSVALAPEIIVNNVAPGLMEGTRMTDNLAPEYAQLSRDSAVLKRAADKDDVASTIVLLTKTESITGQTIVVDAGKVFH